MALSPTSSRGSGTLGVPVATPSGVTVNTTTYNDPVSGSGKLTTLVFPADGLGSALAIALAGDAFPRWLFTADAGNGLYLGAGTADPTAGASLSVGGSGGLTLGSAAGAKMTLAGKVRMHDLPTADPAVNGDLWNSAGTVKVSAG